MNISKISYKNLLKELTDIGVALSLEKDSTKLLELILRKAKELTNADAATLYERTPENNLKFSIMLNDSLGLYMGGVKGEAIQLSPLSMYDKEGNPNQSLVASYVATSKQPVNIKHIYQAKNFDFTHTYKWDKKIGYGSVSFLAVSMTNHENEVIGVLQLINAQDEKKTIIPFSDLSQQLTESLASQAAVSLTNHTLIEEQKNLFNAIIRLIASAIDAKSPYTAKHCRRVPVLTRMLAEATCRINKGPLKDFTMNEDEKYELEVAAWLHDCGKITTPEHVVNKATKLETIFDRINLVNTRFEILKRDALIEYLQQQLNTLKTKKIDFINDAKLTKKLKTLEAERQFINECNRGKEAIFSQEIERINQIATLKWQNAKGIFENLLSESEVKNLQIYRGTLSDQERFIMNNHVSVTKTMLDSLPYPKKLKKVPEVAGAHHEKVNGTGYPQGLTKEEIPIQARMLAIADIFEALSAPDRPYKKALKLSECIAILFKMKQEGHIDPDLFDIFIHEKVYLNYANHYLDKENCNAFDIKALLGYVPLAS